MHQFLKALPFLLVVVVGPVCQLLIKGLRQKDVVK